MTYHWTIDGVPACHSPLTLLSVDLPSSEVSTVCSHQTRESAEAAVAAVRDFYAKHGYTDFDFQVVEGGCSQPDSQDTYFAESCDRSYKAGARKAVELADNPEELERRLIEAGVLPSQEQIAKDAAAEVAYSAAYEKQSEVKKAVQKKLHPDWG